MKLLFMGLRNKLMFYSRKLFLFFTLSAILFFQINSRTIIGVVRDIGYRSVDNVAIHAKETGKYTVSMKDGYFELIVPDDLKIVTLIFESRNHYDKTVRIELKENLKPITVLLIQKEYLRNEVLVTAYDTKERSITLPKAQNIISELEVREKISESLVDTLTDSPGVHFIGSGGFMTTPSIRGLARRRVLLLLDGVRITGDRRAGNSGSFLSPELIKQIEVVRSSSSVVYGSDAVGGVIQLITDNDTARTNSNRSFNISLNSISSRISSGFSILQKSGKFLFNTGVQYSKAGNYSTPEREIFNSGYNNISGILNLTFSDEKRIASIRYIGGSGNDIGKPDRENDPDSYSTVTENSNHIFLFKYDQKDIFKGSDLRLNLFLNPTTYILEKGDIKNENPEISDTSALNTGFGIKLTKKLSENFSITSGVDMYYRNNVDITNTQNAMTTTPLNDGKRKDIGIFISGNIAEIMGLNLRGGIRYTFADTSAISNNSKRGTSTNSPSLFLGIVKNFPNSLSIFLNTGTSFRNPSLSEAYYTGITGRKYVIGNPNLEPEKSFNIDTGIKLHSGNFFIGFYLFYNDIKDMIERYKIDDGTYTYNNIDSGKISGAETEFQWFPSGNIELFGHFNYYYGRSDKTEDPLNDIPSPKLFLGGKINLGKSWIELNLLHSFRKGDPGPSEVENDNYNLLTLKGGHYFSSKFFTYLKISNLLNRNFFPNPDPDIPENDGINISAGVNLFF